MLVRIKIESMLIRTKIESMSIRIKIISMLIRIKIKSMFIKIKMTIRIKMKMKGLFTLSHGEAVKGRKKADFLKIVYK